MTDFTRVQVQITDINDNNIIIAQHGRPTEIGIDLKS